jgi:hypothetical protein
MQNYVFISNRPPDLNESRLNQMEILQNFDIH